MSDITDPLHLTLKEEKVAKVIGRLLITGVLGTGSVSLWPLFLGAAFTLPGQLAIGGSFLATVSAIAFFMMNERGRSLASGSYRSYLLIFTRLWRLFVLAAEEGDSEDAKELVAKMTALGREIGIEDPVQEPEMDPLEAIEQLLTDMRAELDEHREHLATVDGILEDARSKSAEFRAEAESASEEALRADKAGDERATGKAIQLMNLKEGSAQRAVAQIGALQAFREILETLADRTELTIHETGDELDLQGLRVRAQAVQEQAVPDELQRTEDERRRSSAMSTLHARVAERAGEIEAHTVAARTLMGRIRIEDIAQSRVAIDRLRSTVEVSEAAHTGTLRASAPPPLPSESPPDPFTSAEQVESTSREARIRRALAAQAKNKNTL